MQSFAWEMIIITKAQLKTILSLNIMTIASAESRDELHNLEEYFEDRMECGANILIAPTYLGASDSEKEELIKRTQSVADDKVFVAGEVRLSDFPYDDDFEDYRNTISKEVEFLNNAGVSMIFLNGADTLIKAKCAALSAFEVTELPICIGFTFTDDGFLSDATSPLCALITLQAMGVDAIGCTFETDIDTAMEIFGTISNFTTVPLYAYLDAYSLTPEIFADYIPNLVNYKCAMIGISKKSTLPHYIEMSKTLWQFKPLMPDFEEINAVCSKKDIVFMDFKGNIVGDNKNILEIKIEDEHTDIYRLLDIVNSQDSGAVCFNVKDMDILDTLLCEYHGRPMIKSDEYGEIAAKEKGAMVLTPIPEESSEVAPNENLN